MLLENTNLYDDRATIGSCGSDYQSTGRILLDVVLQWEIQEQ